MKNGYLQLKISELNDKIIKLDQIIKMENSKIDLLEGRLGNLKQLIKKLKDLDNFKNNIIKENKVENKKIINNQIEKLTKKISNDIDSILKTKFKDMDEISLLLKNNIDTIKKQIGVISDLTYNISYLKLCNEFLMMKLVNKAIISDREVEEINRRAYNRAKNKK